MAFTEADKTRDPRLGIVELIVESNVSVEQKVKAVLAIADILSKTEAEQLDRFYAAKSSRAIVVTKKMAVQFQSQADQALIDSARVVKDELLGLLFPEDIAAQVASRYEAVVKKQISARGK